MNQESDLEEIFRDPISFDLMEEAMITRYGQSFSNQSITDWLTTNHRCPLSNQPLSINDLIPNYALRDAIEHYKRSKINDASPADIPTALNRMREQYMRIKIDAKINSHNIESSQRKLRCIDIKLSQLNDEITEIDQRMRLDSSTDRLQTRKTEISSKIQSLDSKETALIIEETGIRDRIAALRVMSPEKMQLLNRAAEISMALGAIAGEKTDFAEELLEIERNISCTSTSRLSREHSELIQRKQQLLKTLEENQMSRESLVHEIQTLSTSKIKLNTDIQEQQQQLETITKSLLEFIDSTSTIDSESDRLARLWTESNSYKDQGNAHFREKQYQLAISRYSLAIDCLLEPLFDPTLYLNRAAALTCLGDYSQSINDCLIVIESNHSHITSVLRAKGHRRIGTNYLRLRKYTEALQSFGKALDIDSNDLDAKANIAHIQQLLRG